MNTSKNQNQSINLTENSNQEGVETMWKRNDPKKFKIYDENVDKVELHCYFIDDHERVINDYFWVEKSAITENGLSEREKSEIEKDAAFMHDCEYAKLYWIEEEKVKSDDDDDDGELSFIVIC
jgi:hypothetical protein